MRIFVYGDDTFRVQEKVKQMKWAFQEKFDPTGLNTAEFSSEQSKFIPSEVLGAVRSMPFLGQKRLVVIRGLLEETKKGQMDVWVDGFGSAPESTIVVFWETSDPKSLEKKPLFHALAQGSEVHCYPFPPLQGSSLNQWVSTRVKQRAGVMSPSALRRLVECVGSDLWQMDQEIGKLMAYARGSEITQEMVDELVHANFEGKIFQLIDAISQRRGAQAIRLLQEERWSGANDHYLFTMLGRQVRVLLGARAMLDENPHASKQELAQILAIHPFVAQKALAQARAFSIEQLKAVHDLLFTFDRQLKTGEIDADMALDLTTVKMIYP